MPDVLWGVERGMLTLDILYPANLCLCNEIYGNPFASKATAASNSVHIQFLLSRNLIVYDDGNLLDIDPACEHVRSNYDPSDARSEVLEACFAFRFCPFPVLERYMVSTI